MDFNRKEDSIFKLACPFLIFPSNTLFFIFKIWTPCRFEIWRYVNFLD